MTLLDPSSLQIVEEDFLLIVSRVLKNVLDEAVKIVFNKSTFICRHHFNIF